jgi:protein O-mannosyl-transferase
MKPNKNRRKERRESKRSDAPAIAERSQGFFEKPYFPAASILILVFIAFIPTLNNDFIPSWDDHIYVTDNLMIRHLDFASIKGFFSTAINGTYVPLTLLSFAIEYRFFGLDPLPYHVTNLLLHLACTLLVFRLFRLLKVDPVYAAVGALFFGIHPMHVESVAWITERKDLLYGIFYLASLVAYINHINNPRSRWKWISLSLFFFCLSLFSKIQAVTLPLSLFLIDYLLLRAFGLKSRASENETNSGYSSPEPFPVRKEAARGIGTLKIILEKVPYLALSLIFGIYGLLVLGKLGALQFNDGATLWQRMFMGMFALANYILKFVAPFRLSALYPLPGSSTMSSLMLYGLSPAILILAVYLVCRFARNTRAVIFGSLFFLVNVMFLLQVVRVGSAFAADRFTYIPYIGLIFIVIWALKEIDKRKESARRPVAVIVSLFIIVFLAMTWDRCETWKNDETLWTDVIEKHPSASPMPYNNRATWFNARKQWDNSISDCSKAIAIAPRESIAYSNRGLAYMSLGDFKKAIADLSFAVQIRPDFANAWANRGIAFLNTQAWDRAVADLTKALELNPRDADSYVNRGIAFDNQGEYEKAISDYSAAISIDPNLQLAYANRQAAFQKLQRGLGR